MVVDKTTVAASSDQAQSRIQILDLGRKKKRAIKDLKNGCGKLMADVEDAIERERSHFPEGDKNRPVSVVVIVEKKRKRGGRGGGGCFPFSPLSPLSLLR